MNKPKLLNDKFQLGQQSNEYVAFYELGSKTPITYTVRITVHHDKSYSNQSRAQIQVWSAPSLQWNEVATLIPQQVTGHDQASAELLKLAALVLK